MVIKSPALRSSAHMASRPMASLGRLQFEHRGAGGHGARRKWHQVEYVGDYPIRRRDVELFNMGGEYLLTRTQQVDFHVAFGLNRNSPDYIVGVGYSWRFDNLFATSTR